MAAVEQPQPTGQQPEATQQPIAGQVDALRKRLQASREAQQSTQPESTNGAASATSDEIEELEIDPSEITSAWDPGVVLVEIMDIVDYKKGENKSYMLTYRALTGTNEGRYRKDWAPKAGGGLVKTARIAEVLGLKDPETQKIKFSDKSKIVGQRMWLNIIMNPQKTEQADGSFAVTYRDEIEFPRGYHPLSAYGMPKEGDPFADGGPVAAGS